MQLIYDYYYVQGWLILAKAASHPANLSLWDSSEAGIEVQMFSTCQQFIYGIKLWAVSHILVDIQDIGQNAGDLGKMPWLNNKNLKPQNVF